jgi:glycosyltransferase involved in cell wall biosynthesis|nr:glycosyltransferase [uncultured Psychroserpens sp.]
MNDTKINITFALPSLAAGGAERVMSFVAQNLDQSKFNVTLLITEFEKNAAYDIKGIPVIYLNKDRVLKAIPALFKYVIKNKPDIVISAIGHLNTVMAYATIFSKRTKFISREVNILSALKDFALKKNTIGSYFSDRRFNYSDKIICQSNDMKEDIQKYNDIDEQKLVVINNPITDAFQCEKTEKTNKKLHFITVARLKEQKGHKRVIDALSKIEFPFHYTIVGDGPEHDNVFAQLEKYNLMSQVTHIENTNEVPKYLTESDVYLQGSFIEGFPNAVIESSAMGTPILAFNAPGGINEIIESNINGHIVEDESEFIQKLNEYHNDYPFKPKDVSHSVTKKYSKAIIVKRYEAVFLDVVNPKSNA